MDRPEAVARLIHRRKYVRRMATRSASSATKHLAMVTVAAIPL
jgi:hypothetical protein